ncbi:Condensin-2 complex subunit G [Trema orientale]|uniref:Condensin-2 complex subunit G n=1 Tax=Trema orientale TaxID=63057 RepID=A0A2P5FSH0_TREOI|nr:Condensin-2 complex subunit G [Trema orientale]
MEKQLRSSLQSSAEDFLASASKFGLKSSRSALKTLIHAINASSDLCSSLPLSLHHSISQAIHSFRNPLEPKPEPGPKPNPSPAKSSVSPPTKRHRRSSRLSKTRVEPDSEPKSEPNPDEGRQRITQNLQIFAYITRLCVSHPKNVFSPLDLLPGVQGLHDNLIVFESDSALSTEILNLCEEWWKEDLAGRESLISQSLPFLLSRSLTLSKKQDVHRVCALREAFSLFDFEDESIEDLKLLLIRCVIAPLYMKTEEGRRFIAFAFGLSRQLLKEFLAMIRSQIPFGSKSMLEAYGDVLFRAWKVAEEDSRDEIESGLLQGLIEGAIYASSATLAASVRRVLGAFINQRTTSGVEKLLFRLAEPVIFRSLQVANSNVRQNALHLLLDLFPCEDPDATKEVKDALLDKQFYLLERMLMDDCPDTRVVAVEGSCRILHLFWEIIPSPTITKILAIVFNEMSHDICNEVRLSTLNGIIYLFGNPHSHEILKVLLPRLRHLILDNVLSIRLAMVDLLLVIRDIRNFQFNKVVELDVLLSTLANDQPHVAQKITKLLMPSYFPSKASTEEACNRCVTLIKRSPMAGARFCEFAVSEGASLRSLMELVKVIISLVLSLEKQQADHVEGLLLAAANLCSTLTREPNYKNALKELFVGENLKSLFARASSGQAQSAIFHIASTISADDVAGLLDGCIELITNCSGLSGDVERQSEVRSAHKLLLSCGQLDGMLEVLTSLLQKTAYRCHIKFGAEVPKLSVSSTKRKKTKSSGQILAQWKHVSRKKQCSFEQDYSVSVGIAWQIEDLLKSEDTRKAILVSQSLEPLFLALKVISEVSILQCLHCEYMDVSSVLAYTALSLHITLENVRIGSLKDCGNMKNGSSDSSQASLKQTVLEQALGYMLNCTEKLFETGDMEKSGKPFSESRQAKNTRRQRQKELEADAIGQNDAGSVYTDSKRLSNKVKMLTSVLKFMTDATTMGFVFHNHEWCLKFTSEYLRHIASTLRRQRDNPIHFEDDDVKYIVHCLKSSLTYAVKLLGLTLKDVTEASPPTPQAFVLANDMLDILTSIELYLGPGYAVRLVVAAKPWLPDLILALGSGHMLMAQRTVTDSFRIHFPSWLLVLAKTELAELSKYGLEEEDDTVSEQEKFLAFKKLLELILVLLKGNRSILDAVGDIFVLGSIVGLEGKDYELVLGLVHFVCVKLFRHDDKEWGDMMLASLQDIYPQIERLMEEESDEDGRQKLESAKALLEPVWMYHVYETGKLSEMDE